ncbi:SCO-spondin isoform X1 [Magallana gigas]|uniref:SCO-spondin isoform X1 n=1 Tax=Magallana gigas TaxID=29159 RepID=UPI003341CC55
MKTASGTLLFLLLFTRVSSQITEIQRDSRIYAFNVNSNLSFVGHEFRNHQISNFSTKFMATQCAMECHRTARCQSFNFASKTRQCLLNDATHEDFPEDLANDSSTTGTVYYLKEAISINPDAIGPCGNHPCKNGGRCLDTISAVSGNRTFFCLCQNGWKGDICDIKEESLGWAQWVEWSQCSTTCGNGYHIRQRKCKNLDSGMDLASSKCYGRDTDYKACQFRKCPRWNEWGVWGECSTLNSCGKGSRSRTRTCGNGGRPGVDRYCLGPVNETMACDSVPCNGMVRLRDGEKFGEGRVEMYHSHSKKWMQVCGKKWTQRSADTACKQRGFLGAHKVLTNGEYGKSDSLDVVSLECTGSESFLHQCLRVRADQCSVMAGVQCMVRGAWSLWSSWGNCSVTCENGTRTRTRVCNHPPPNFRGRECPDTDIEYKPCTMIMCPVDGIWREWSTWSECSVSCANGTKYRTRSCLGPFHEGQNCSGDYRETTDCFPKECPVDGVWNGWMQWSECTVSCGYGTRNRSRTCKGPYYKGKECDGPKDETESCNAFSCPVDGSWKTWNGWESCSVTCGGGIQNRTRECNLPLHGGETCIGHSEESRKCNEHPCPVDGVWTAWADWSDCSVTCANGTQWRNRTCVGPRYGGMNCTGDETQEKICVAASCPVNGVWKPWSEWDSCNVTCGGGEKARRRECNGPFFDGDPCEGPTEERLTCNTFNCPIDGVWEAWTTWTSCSRPCGTGEQVRSRNCAGPFYNGSDCLGDWNQTKTCNTHSCAVDGYWHEWSNWTSCNVSCGGGSIWRRRRCEQPLFGGENCTGPSVELQDCNTFPCPVDGVFTAWGDWSACSLTCGNGTQSKNRSCEGPYFGGKNCTGDWGQTKDCNTFPCPVDGFWLNWSNWSDCSKSCGRGFMYRTRVCEDPKYGGSECVGVSNETMPCNPSSCPVDGLWNTWQAWSDCFGTCGVGIQYRNRTCDGPYYGGSNCTGPENENQECFTKECPVDGLFTEWLTWSHCSVSCGGSLRNRTRSCIGPFFGGKDCEGPRNDSEVCGETPCPVDGEWSLWSSWGGCSETCGKGQTQRYRYCTENKFGGKNCSGDSLQHQDCNDFPCPIDGVFNPWSNWTECSKTCGTGIQSRNRTCDGPYHNGQECMGNYSDSQECNTHHCPVDGVFMEWSTWTDCSLSCGSGKQSRSRICVGPFYGGSGCDGSFQDNRTCNDHHCPVDGVWDDWGPWKDCDVTCGGGNQTRERTCTGPFYGGAPCNGSWNDTQECNTFPCPVDGLWLSWGGWGTCNVTCGGGTRLRNRTCDGPYFGGKSCEGEEEDSSSCNDFPCPIDGVWNPWSIWDNCSESCGGGNQSRYRTCDGPYYGGMNCSGNDTEARDCNTHHCPVDGVFGNWSQWYDCSVTCGGGVQWRNRSCIGPFYGGKDCSGAFEESSTCNTHPCPIDGKWKSWGEWDTCNVTCGGGIQKRVRDCDGPFHGGNNCTGPADSYQECNTQPCPVDGVWKDWAGWGECSLSCGGGIQTRFRDCNGPFHGGANCTGPDESSQACNTQPCPVDGEFTDWTDWGKCDVTCGGGSQLRSRACNGPFHGGQNCSGAWEETQTCNSQNCPEDGVWMTWSLWGDCTVTCGGGLQYRNRSCDGPRYGGAECAGAGEEQRDCGKNPCPIPGDWMSWSGWSRCSATCGTGVRWRTRDCNETSYGDLTAPCEGTSNGTEDCNTFPCRPYAATCSNLRDMGMVDSGMVQLKPERRDLYSEKPELEPVWLYCDMESEGGIGVTVVGHDKESRTNVNGYEGAGSYLAKVTYEVSTDHVIAIIDQSKFCKQFLRWECKGAVIHNPHQKDSWTTFWTNRSSEFNQYNTPATYFPGAKPGSGNCACGDTGTCTNKSLSCNCDSNDFEWRSDEGFVTYKDDLPILAFRAGDTGNEPVEQGAHTIGRVYCQGVA